MLRYCFPILCTTLSLDATFRRALGTQSTQLDLVPVKKPLIDGSLSWFIEEHIEIILVSGIKGISHDEVSNAVKRRAIYILQQCGDGDALKGCYIIRKCMEESRNVLNLLDRLDMMVRLRLKSDNSSNNNNNNNNNNTDNINKEYESSDAFICSVYETDAWEPHPKERHLLDIYSNLNSSTNSLEKIIREAMNFIYKDAEKKEEHFAEATLEEIRLLLSSQPCINLETRKPFIKKENCLYDEENSLLNSIISSSFYSVNFELVECDSTNSENRTRIAGSWILKDEIENIEKCDIPLVVLKGKNGILYNRYFTEYRQNQNQNSKIILEEEYLENQKDNGKITRVTKFKNEEDILKIINSLLEQPLLQFLQLRTSGEILCNSFSPIIVEDYIRSCGRIDIDAWIMELGYRPITIPITPRYLENFDYIKFLNESLSLEYGNRGILTTILGPLKFSYHVSITLNGKIITALNCFNSPISAVSILIPWYVAAFSPNIIDNHLYQYKKQQQQKQQINNNNNKNNNDNVKLPLISNNVNNDQQESYRLFTLNIIDIPTSLKNLGVTSAKLNSNTLEYYDASGVKIFKFEQIDSLQGIERFIKRIRFSNSVCFTPINIYDSPRVAIHIIWKFFSKQSIIKFPPYTRRIRIPIPFISDEFISLRFSSNFEMDEKEYNLLQIFQRYSEKPEEWPLKPLTPCFFNKWRLTRSIIKSIKLNDENFRYTIELSPNLKDDNKRIFILKFYSGDEMKKEIFLEETNFLFKVKEFFTDYASQWNIKILPIEELVFAMPDIKKNINFSFKGIVSTLLQGSEIYVQNNHKISLEVQITSDIRIILANDTFKKNDTMKEIICRNFIIEQFPSLLPTIDILRRAYAIITSYSGNEEVAFRCRVNNSNNNFNFRWELYKTSIDSTTEVTILEVVEGSSRLDALASLVEKCFLQKPKIIMEETNKVIKVKDNSLYFPTIARTIEEYQVMLAQQRGVEKIIHEYNKSTNELVIKGVNCSKDSKTLYSSTTTTTTTTTSNNNNNNNNTLNTTIIRIIPLSNTISIGLILHRYYRKELNLPNPPATKSLEELRALSLTLVYEMCRPHFTFPLPSLEEAIKVKQTKIGWEAVLQIPAKLFALGPPNYIEYIFKGRGKHEGRRSVIQKLYFSIFGEAPQEIEKFLSEIMKNDVSSYETITSSTTTTNNNNNNNNKTRKIKKKIKTTSNITSNIINNNDNSRKSENSNCNINILPPIVKPRQLTACMYSDLLQLIANKLYSHVGYSGNVECRLSFITGIIGRYVRYPIKENEFVELFQAPLLNSQFLPLQILSELFTCARKLLLENELKENILNCAEAWPSLFLDSAPNKRLFCTTFLRRYLGLCIYEENDVDIRVNIPGTMYLLERNKIINNNINNNNNNNNNNGKTYEASLALVQTPLKTSNTKFMKSLVVYRNSNSAGRAELEMWENVAEKLHTFKETNNSQTGIDNAVLCMVARTSIDKARES